jgi:hypothetical protein
MTGKLNPPKPLAAGLLPWIKRPAPLVGIVILAIAAAATGAWLTEPPASAPPRVAKAGKARRGRGAAGGSHARDAGRRCGTGHAT